MSRFNTQSSLTFNEIRAIVDDLENRYKEMFVDLNADDIAPYKTTKGKILGLREFMYELEDHVKTRQLRDNEDTGDIDEL